MTNAAPGHQADGEHQALLAAVPVGVGAEQRAADRAHDEPDGEHGQRRQQGRRRVALARRTARRRRARGWRRRPSRPTRRCCRSSRRRSPCAACRVSRVSEAASGTVGGLAHDVVLGRVAAAAGHARRSARGWRTRRRCGSAMWASSSRRTTRRDRWPMTCGCRVSWNSPPSARAASNSSRQISSERPGRRVGPQRAVALHHQVGGVVADPLDRDLHDPGAAGRRRAARRARRRPSATSRSAGPSCSMIASVWSEKSQLGVRMPTGRAPESFSRVVERAAGEVELVGAVEQHVALVDPAVHADLVPARGVGLHLLRVQQRRHRGHEEAGGHPVLGEQREDLRARPPGSRTRPARACPAGSRRHAAGSSRGRSRTTAPRRRVRRPASAPGRAAARPGPGRTWPRQVGSSHCHGSRRCRVAPSSRRG